MDPYVLHDATRLVLKNAGSAGLDRQTCESIRGKEWAFAQEIRESLQSGSYRTGAVRRVYIPKKDGRQRPLGIPNLRDRVVQRALGLVRRCIYVWMKEAGLKLKEEKTRVVDMTNARRSHDSKFDFLGYKFHLRAYTDNPKRFWIARQPSEKARKSLHENLKARLQPQLTKDQAKQALDQVWRGWSNYFRYGNSNRIFYREVKAAR